MSRAAPPLDSGGIFTAEGMNAEARAALAVIEAGAMAMAGLEARVAKLSPKPGDILLVTVPEVVPGPLDEILAVLSARLREAAPGAFLVLLPPGWAIENLSDKQLAAVGLVRKAAAP